MRLRKNIWKYFVMISAICLLTCFGMEKESHAKPLEFAFSPSLGPNYSLVLPKGTRRMGVNLEVLGSFYVLYLVSADMGLSYDFLKNNLMFRPGARLFLGWLYFRIAIPLALNFHKTSTFNLGLLLGVGLEAKIVKKIGIKVEANISPFFLQIDDQGINLPAELRMGVVFYF